MARRRRPIGAGVLLLVLLAVVVAVASSSTPASAQAPAPPDDAPPGGGDSRGDSGDAPPAPAPADPPPAPPPPTPPPLPPCDQLPTLPGTPADRCAFFRAHCADADEGAAFPYAGAYWCGAAVFPPWPALAFLAQKIYVLLVLLCLPFLFALLGDTAERYFSPIMACVSQSIPKMRPRFAGVTLVALGNGAPDLSANASAIRSGEYLLAAGAITGGAMFVQCVVGAQVIAIASSSARARGRGGGGGGVRCGGAMMRDAGVFGVAAASLALALLSGRVGRGYVAWSVALYALYVAWVFAGDEWHAAGRPDTEQVRRSLLTLRERVAAMAAAGGGGGFGGGFGGPAPGRRRPPLDDAGIDDEPSLLLPASAAAAGAPWASADEGGGGAAGVPPPPGLGGGGRGASLAAGAATPPPTQTLAPRRGDSGGLGHHHHSHHHQGGGGYVDPLTYRQLVWADMADDDGGEGALIEASLARREQRRRERRRRRREQREDQRSGAAAAGAGSGALRELGVRRHHGGEEEQDEEDDDDEAVAARELSAPLPEAGGGNGDASAPEGLSPRRPRHQGAGGVSSAGLFGGDAAPPNGTAAAVAAAAAADADFPPTSPAALRRLLFGADAPAPLPPAPSASPSDRLLAWLPPDWGARLYARARRAATHGASDEWDDPAANTPPPQRLFRALTLPMLLSTYLLQRATIPLADPGPAYSRGWLLTSVVGFPLWMTAYSGAASGAGGRWWVVWAAALAVGLLASRGLALYTAGSPGTPPALPLPFAAAAAARGREEGGMEEEEEEADVEGLLVSAAAAANANGAAPPRSPPSAVASSLASAGSSSSLAHHPPPPPGPAWLGRAVPAALALAGFAAGVAWIDAVASQAVQILALAATLARLPQGVVGLTLLAWGNSLGDYFGNAALARAGAGSTAITACFAGPLFNVLISMALGFSARFAKLGRQAAEAAAAAAADGGGGGGGAAAGEPPPPPTSSSFRTDSVPVRLTPEVALGCGCLVLYSATAVAVGRACGGRLPPWFATVARLFYLAYFCGAVGWGLSSAAARAAAGEPE